MMCENLRKYYQGGLDVTIIVPGGEKIARRTFNAKVGVMGGISILGTTGIVHPFSHEAYVDAMEREMKVALAMGVERIVLNSGKRSELAIHEHYPQLPPQSFVHYGNFIGDALRIAQRLGVKQVTLGVMIGKAVKLAAGFDNTHSYQVTMDRDFVAELARQVGCSQQTLDIIQEINMARQLITDLPRVDYELLKPMIVDKCLQTCKRIYTGRLEFILLDSLL
jgi:cobalt-precorrin-5B (C1)-methyltransferase